MALFECDIKQNLGLPRSQTDQMTPLESYPNYQRTHSESPSPQNNYKGLVKHETTLPSINTIGRQLTTGLSPHARRLNMSSSATVSPRKSIILPKRSVTSASNSPCFSKRRNQSVTIDFTYSDHHSTTKSSFKSDNEVNCLSARSGSNLFADGLFDFSMCDRCSKLCPRSLDLWIDHLGEVHPVPLCWPSSRINHLSEYEQKHPYTTVVGSNKKRKAGIVPRPLNSFMIFAQYLRRVVLHWFPDAPNVHISQRVGQLWRKLDAQMREKYVLEAYRLQHLHSIEFPHYKYQPKKRTRADENNNVSKSLDVQSCVSVPSECRNTDQSGSVAQHQTPSNGNLYIGEVDANSIVYWDDPDYDGSLGNNFSVNADTILHRKSKIKQMKSDCIHTEHMNSKLSRSQAIHATENISINTVDCSPHCTDDDDGVGAGDTNGHASVFVENANQTDETLTLLVSGENIEQPQFITSHTESDDILISSDSRKSLAESKYLCIRSQSIDGLMVNKASVFANNLLYEAIKSSENNHHILVPLRTNLSTADTVSNNSESVNFRSFTPSLSSISPVSLEFDNLSHSTQITNDYVEPEFEPIDAQIKADEHTHIPILNNSTNISIGVDSRIKPEPDPSIMNDKTQYFDEVDSRNPVCDPCMNVPITSSDIKFEFPLDIQEMDNALSFNDIDTCKTGISLDDLDQMTLFPNELTNSLVPIKLEDGLDACLNGKIGVHVNHPKPICPRSLTGNCTGVSPLPCIESWTFEKFNNCNTE